jgi:pyrroline-5-carboxylate reductase
VFSVAIPAMAEIISKSGLNRQDSLRIATEQVLSAQRREYEKMQEEKKEKLKRMIEITKMGK